MKVLTANRLIDGEAVWYASGRGWIETLDGAELARDKEAEERLSGIGKASYQRDEVVDVDLIDIELVDGRIVPTRLRERIRAAGPSIHPNLGKQARPAAVRSV
jgi:hypothetical protein